jgi:hypothetical protein
MKRAYSAWGVKEEGEARCLVQGEVPPRFANGVIDTYCPDLHFTFEANSWEEAMAIYHLRQGWEPYRPNGNPAACPSCDAVYYPSGSGQCWRCGNDS